MQLICLGIIGKIYMETRQRPRCIISECKNRALSKRAVNDRPYKIRTP